MADDLSKGGVDGAAHRGSIAVRLVAIAWLAVSGGISALAAAPATAAGDTGAGAPAPRAASSAGIEHGMETPRSAVRGYLEACRAGDFARAATYLELPGADGPVDLPAGPVLARHLLVVLDRTLWIDVEGLSSEPAGFADDELPRDVDRVGTLHSRQGAVEVMVRRSDDAGGEWSWRIASSTVRRVPALYDEFGYGALGEWLPEQFFVLRFLEIRLWQWIGLGLVALAAYPVGCLVARVLKRLARPLVRRTESQLDDRLIELAIRPIRAIAALAFFAAGVVPLSLAVPAQRVVGQLERGTAIVLVGWLLLRIADVVFEGLQDGLRRDGRVSLAAVLPLARRAAKAAVILLVGIVMLQTLGMNVTGLLAGLGVGGLALALAAQKTVENLFGGVSLTADQPVRVGDLCKWGDRIGTIEDVGLRSTKIRTIDRTVVTVPNAQFSQIELENFGMRDRIRLYTVLSLRYETTPDQLRHVLTELRKLLVAHPRIHPDPLRVRLIAFSPSSFDVEVFAYVATTEFEEFAAVREDILLRIVDILQASGTGFAFPSQTLYLGRDTGLDDTRAREAERAVRGWREAGELPFPDLPGATEAELRHSLDYPPRGSAARGPA